VDRFHILSPCKADLVVEAHKADDGFCKCDEYKHDRNEIVYKLQKVRCVSDQIVKRTVPINADGTCPETYIRTGGNKIKMRADELEKTHERQNTFSCATSAELPMMISMKLLRNANTSLCIGMDAWMTQIQIMMTA
jgi:hypothetical protein